MSSPFSLKDKKILITGASSGIGRACAIACSQSGAKLLLVGRNIEALERTKQELVNSANAVLCIIDLTKFDEVSGKIKILLSEFGAIDGVVHAAGISTTLPFRNTTPEKMDQFFQTNVSAALHLTQQLIKPSHISSNGASIVFLTSIMAEVGESAKVIYSMTKGALLAASRSMAVELASKKIRVNCIAPGVVDTPMTQKAYYSQNDELKERINNLHPLGVGIPEDVANASIFLLSDASRWITGTQLVVDGGYTAR